MDRPTRFEDEFPEAGQALAEICKERGARKTNGKRLKPLFLDACEPIKVEIKIGRNDPCPCGSTKKYKKCCG